MSESGSEERESIESVLTIRLWASRCQYKLERNHEVKTTRRSFHKQRRICSLFVAAEGTNQASGDKSSDNGAERMSALSRTSITEASYAAASNGASLRRTPVLAHGTLASLKGNAPTIQSSSQFSNSYTKFVARTACKIKEYLCAAGEERDLNVMAKGRREGRMKRGTEEVKRANERASGATREISGCAIDWRADDANAQPTSTSVD
ncbi:hypothetical protein ALC53_01619 [Atta colombica]|uniref:Uncharacterized protein n=1 Tax=Atta colombica TaxID=520822 RepID=A0A195BV34_9HYME|nr:hypothetical protein ALC53_01619 [Atta colombica]